MRISLLRLKILLLWVLKDGALRRGGGEQRSANQGEAFPFPNHQPLITNHFLVSFAFFRGILYLKTGKISRLSSLVSRLADER